MAWQDTMITMLRVVINDMTKTPDYSDMRLEELLVVAAQFVKTDVNLDNTYTIDISDQSITPDPTDGTQDDKFINLTVMKAACMVDMGNMRVAALSSGIKATCGPAQMDTLQRMPGYKILMENGYCAAYEHFKLQDAFGNATFAKAILSPFISNDFDPDTLQEHRGWTDEHKHRI